MLFLTIFLDNTLLNLDKNNDFISFFLAKTLHLDNHGYILIFINLGKTITKDGRKIMTEKQYVRANRTVLFTVLIVFGYIALTLMAALGVGDGYNKGKILIQFVVALAVIIISVAAYILRKKTRVCELTIAVSMALGYVVLILLNSTDGVWKYVIASVPMVIAYVLFQKVTFNSYLIYMLLMIIIGVVTYGIMLLILGDELVREEVRMIFGKLKHNEK